MLFSFIYGIIFIMKELTDIIKLIFIFLVVVGLIILIILLAPDSLKLTPPSQIFPK
jgi:hypothetical protein